MTTTNLTVSILHGAHKLGLGMHSLAKRPFSIAAVAALALVSSGCEARSQAAFFEAEDVSLDVPHLVTNRSATLGDGIDADHGDITWLIRYTAQGTNQVVALMVGGIGEIVNFLNSRPPTSVDGEWRVYGPIDDEDGKDVSWAVKISGDELGSKFEVLVGDAGETDIDEMDLFLTGDLNIDGDNRDGGVLLDFGVIEKHPQLKEAKDAAKTFEGAVELSFTRNVETDEKSIDIDFQDLSIVDEGYLDSEAFFSDDAYNFKRNEDGSGSFHLGLYAEFDEKGWSGPEMKHMLLDAVWNGDHEGRSRGSISETEGAGDLTLGDLEISECFTSDGTLVWREISEAYAKLAPEYALGDEQECKFGDDDLK